MKLTSVRNAWCYLDGVKVVRNQLVQTENTGLYRIKWGFGVYKIVCTVITSAPVAENDQVDQFKMNQNDIQLHLEKIPNKFKGMGFWG